MVEIILGVLIVVLLGALGGAVFFLRRIPVQPTPPLQTPYDETPLRERVRDLEVAQKGWEASVSDLYEAVANGIRDVERNKKRVEAIVRRTRTQLEEGGFQTGALDAEHADLFPVDGERSEEGQLSLLPEDLDQDQPSSIPGVTRGQVARARGFR